MTEPAAKDPHPVVCGTDFSENATEAAEVAAALARKLGTKLILVHVDEFRGLAMSDPGLFESIISEKKKDLAREADRLRKLGTTVEELHPSGVIFEELIQAAVKARARLIVVGAVGHGLARRLLVGSVAERVAERSSVPTLVVRPHGHLVAWLAGEQTLKVLAGYDFSDASDAALRWLGGLSEIGPCEISITHVDWPPEEAHRFGNRGPFELHGNQAQMQTFLERDLREHVALNLTAENVTLSVNPSWGRVDSHLLQIAQARESDLIVVGTHGRHGLGRLRFGSISRGVLHQAAVSVVVIPAPEDNPARRTVPKINRLLAATDFSDLGNEAVRYACAILPHGGTLHLVHVLEGAESNPKLAAQLRALVPTNAARRIEIEVELIPSSSSAQAIAQAAERCDADVICLGSHGRTGLAKAVLGSVAQAVMIKSKRPVLVIRPHD